MYDNEFMEQLLQGISVQEERRHPGKTEDQRMKQNLQRWNTV